MLEAMEHSGYFLAAGLLGGLTALVLEALIERGIELWRQNW